MSYRLLAVPVAGVALILLGVLVFGNLSSNLVYYLTVEEAVAQRAAFADGRRFRLAGEVAVGSLQRQGDTARFTMSDGTHAIRVRHRGVPPQLFREGIRVVVEGAWQGESFRSHTIIVKHDNTYRPPRPAATSRQGAER